MNDCIKTIVNSEKEISSDAEGFYEKYWGESGDVGEDTINKNSAIIGKLFPSGLQGKKILEIGVGGEGGLIRQLKSDNEIFGIDVSDSAINNCRRFGLNVLKANLDSESMPFQNDCFDVIIAFEVFEHFANPQRVIEEIRRALKPGGVFVCSTPSTYTYHWPRLFYAGLFELENFRDFIMVNGFNVSYLDDWVLVNRYHSYHVPGEMSSWSWYWHSTKLSPSDDRGYFELGRHFWEKRDELGIRTRPVEAVDLFRKSHEIAPDNDTSMLYFAHALIYRLINNDSKEFDGLLDGIFARLQDPAGKNKIAFLARVLLMDLEARRLGFRIFSQEDYEKLKRQLGQAEGTLSLLVEIDREETVNQRLLALA